MRPQPVNVLVVLACLCATVGAASAQDRLIIEGRDVGTIGRFGQDLGPAPPDLTAGPVFGGGRYVLVAPLVYDRRTGAQRALPNGWQPLLGDPVRPRVYAWVPPSVPGANGALTMLDVVTGATSTVMQLPDPGALSYVLRLAIDADVVVAIPNGIFGSLTGRAHLANVALGLASQREIPLPIGLSQFALTPDGTRLFAVAFPLSGYQVLAFDTGSGAQVAAAPGGSRLRWDATLDALVAVEYASVQLLSRDLIPLAVGAFQDETGGCDASLIVSPHTGRIYTLSGGGHYFSLRFPQLLRVLDPKSGWSAPVNVNRSLGIGSECVALPEIQTAPGAPRGLQATVSGNTVSLQWQHVGAAHTFVMTAGIAPGRTDATVPLGPDSHVTFRGVPPGTYYLRMRGVNEFGAGRWSNEVRVVVP